MYTSLAVYVASLYKYRLAENFFQKAFLVFEKESFEVDTYMYVSNVKDTKTEVQTFQYRS